MGVIALYFLPIPNGIRGRKSTTTGQEWRTIDKIQLFHFGPLFRSILRAIGNCVSGE